MGPIALFDKSFLQSLSLDEAVWFDNFFIANIAPPFLLETLADLSKDLSRKKRRNTTDTELEVRALALKTPELGSAANAFHVRACIANLMGSPIAMTGQILVAGGAK